MFGALEFVGHVVMSVVDSQNKRDVEICKDNNHTRVEISKIILGGVALIGTLALQFYCTSKNEKPEIATASLPEQSLDSEI